MNWSDGDDRLDESLKDILINGIRQYPLMCPICKKNSLNVYFLRRGTKSTGGVWIWCSNCHSFTHGTVQIPIWWENCIDIEEEKLTALPLYQEKERERIGEHIKHILGCEIENLY